jgi:hypothetical protein
MNSIRIAPLLVTLLPLFAFAAPPARQIVSVTPTDPRQFDGPASLPGELVRQALLSAARDGLGADTRDIDLRETVPDTAITFDLVAHVYRSTGYDITLSCHNHPEITLTAHIGKSQEMAFNKVDVDVFDAATHCDSLSRHEFIDLLRRAGVKEQLQHVGPIPVRPAANDMSLFAGFDAVRRAHATIRAKGQTSDAIAALVRGYSNLALSAQLLWYQPNAVFGARSLLYAERLMDLEHQSADALRYRAYARAVAGLGAGALDDLDAADKQSAIAPPSANIIRQFCLYNTDALLKLGANPTSPDAALANTLATDTVFNTLFTGYVMPVINTALARPCDTLRLTEEACHLTGPGPLNQLVASEPALLATVAAHWLPKIDGVSTKTRTAAIDSRANPDDFQRALDVTTGLFADATTDTQEPSLQALARMVQDVQFIQSCRRLAFEEHDLGVDASADVTALEPLVAGHKYKEFIQLFRPSEPDARKDIAAKIQQLDLSDLPEISNSIFCQQLKYADPNNTKLLDDAQGDADWNAMSLDYAMGHWHRAGTGLVDCLKRFNPHSPMIAAGMVFSAPLQDEPEDEPIIVANEKNPFVMLALADRAIGKNDTIEATDLLKRLMIVAPDGDVYGKLENIYLKQKDFTAWHAALDRFLKSPSYTLDHTNAETKFVLANAVMTPDYKGIEAYALDAAKSGSESSMEVACWEEMALGKYAESEYWCRRNAERYESERWSWYEWCVATGKGNKTAARQFALDAAAKYQNSAYFQQQIATFETINGNQQAAAAIIQHEYETTANPQILIGQALAADIDGHADQRDALLNQYKDKVGAGSTPTDKGLAKFLNFYSRAIAGGTPPTLQEVHGLIDLGADDPPATAYLVGRICELHWSRDLAKAAYKRGIAPFGMDLPMMAKVTLRLTAMGEPIADLNPGEGTGKSSPAK